MKPSSESVRPFGHAERKKDQFALAGKSAGTAAQLKPLGLRYSFLVRGSDGRDREVNAATASQQKGSVHLTAETNQGSYVQIWTTIGSSTPQLLFPEKESGQISSKMIAGHRQSILLPTESGTVTVRLSRMPFGPITRQ